LQRRVILLEGFPALGSYRAFSYIPEGRPLCQLAPNCRFAYDRRDENVLWMASDECACILDEPLTEHERWPLDEDQTMLQAYEAARAYWSDYRSKL